MAENSDRRPLAGVRIIEMAWLYTGPVAARFLSDFGAEVIKIEAAHRPDDVRGYMPFHEGKPGVNRSAVFANFNCGKLSMTLDLGKPQGIALLKKLVAKSDVLLESFRPGMMERWGLEYSSLQRLNPGLIMLSISMQGQTGPRRRQPGFGAWFQSALGFNHLLGWPDRSPAALPTPYPDFVAPWVVLSTLLAALDYRRRTGKGQYLDVNQLEATLHLLTPTLLDYAANGRVRGRIGNRSERMCPHGAYRCQGEDRWCAIAVATDEQWKALCRASGHTEWLSDPRLSTFRARKSNEDELDSLIEAWTSTRTAEAVMELLQAVGVPAGVVESGRDLVENDPQLEHRGHCQVLEHSEFGRHVCEAVPFRLSKSPGMSERPAPCLGQHNEEVCTRVLGLSDAEFVELAAKGAFG